MRVVVAVSLASVVRRTPALLAVKGAETSVVAVVVVAIDNLDGAVVRALLLAAVPFPGFVAHDELYCLGRPALCTLDVGTGSGF